MNTEGRLRELIREELDVYTKNIIAELEMREQVALDMREYQKSVALAELAKVMETMLPASDPCPVNN
jgi:predicted transcriptional regulator